MILLILSNFLSNFSGIVSCKPIGNPSLFLANGKLIAKGEVVVIDENFAIRITKILKQPNMNNDY